MIEKKETTDFTKRNKAKKKLSKISIHHYIKLALRSTLFVTVLVFYILEKTELLKQNFVLPVVVWIFFMLGMGTRFHLN